MLCGAAKTELVFSANQRHGVHQLQVIFGARRVKLRSLPQADDARDFEQRARRVRSQLDGAPPELEAQLIEERGAHDRLPSGGEGLILVPAAAARRGVTKIVAAQNLVVDAGSRI